MRRIERDFPERNTASEVARMVSETSDSERIQAAMILYAHGNLSSLKYSIELARVDWRDLLVDAGLAHETWYDILDRELRPQR